MTPVRILKSRVQEIRRNVDILGMDAPKVHPAESSENLGDVKSPDQTTQQGLTPRRGMQNLSFQLVASKFGMPLKKLQRNLKLVRPLWYYGAGYLAFPDGLIEK